MKEDGLKKGSRYREAERQRGVEERTEAGADTGGGVWSCRESEWEGKRGRKNRPE